MSANKRANCQKEQTAKKSQPPKKPTFKRANCQKEPTVKRANCQKPVIGDVRGPGLFLGIELTENDEELHPATAKASYLANRMRDLGILMSTDGPFENVLKIKPPIVFNKMDAEFLLEKLDRVFNEDFMKLV